MLASGCSSGAGADLFAAPSTNDASSDAATPALDSGPPTLLDSSPGTPYADSSDGGPEIDGGAHSIDASEDVEVDSADAATCFGTPLGGNPQQSTRCVALADDGACPTCAGHGYACADDQKYPAALPVDEVRTVSLSGGKHRLCSPEARCVRAEQSDQVCPSAKPLGFSCASGAAMPEPGCQQMIAGDGVSAPLFCCP